MMGSRLLILGLVAVTMSATIQMSLAQEGTPEASPTVIVPDLGFLVPDGVTMAVLASEQVEGVIDDLSFFGGARLTFLVTELESGAVWSPEWPGGGVELVYVERGSVVFENTGLEGTYTEGRSVLFPSPSYRVRNEDEQSASLLRLHIGPISIPLADGPPLEGVRLFDRPPPVDTTPEPAPEGVTEYVLFGTDIGLDDIPPYGDSGEESLFIVRARWQPGVELNTGPLTGVLGVYGEEGTLIARAPGESTFEGTLSPGTAALYLPGDELEARNPASEPALLLMAGFITASDW